MYPVFKVEVRGFLLGEVLFSLSYQRMHLVYGILVLYVQILDQKEDEQSSA